MGLVIECWRPVVGFEDGYEISDLGNVRSIDRAVLRNGNSRGGVQNRLGRVLRSQLSGEHLRVKLAGRKKYVHVLVLEAFVGPRPTGMEACHNNGVASDNRLSNLRWDTLSSNRIDRKYHAGVSIHKLRPQDVRLVRSLLQTRTGREIAGIVGVNESGITKIKYGRTHRDVE